MLIKKSFGGKNFAPRQRFYSIKSQRYVLFFLTLNVVQIYRIFFLSVTLHLQKKLKEIAYVLACYQTLLKAQIVCLFVLLTETQ